MPEGRVEYMALLSMFSAFFLFLLTIRFCGWGWVLSPMFCLGVQAGLPQGRARDAQVFKPFSALLCTVYARACGY